MLIAMTDQGQESRVRKLAVRRGFVIRKSREHTLHLHNCGQFRLVNVNNNMVVLGENFDANLDSIEAYLNSL